MEITLADRTIRVFTISPRASNATGHLRDLLAVADWTEHYGGSGVLVFTGNDVMVEPWVATQAILARTTRLMPLVAINPIYMHPFSAARFVMSISRERLVLDVVDPPPA